jgi:hypothetical protein
MYYLFRPSAETSDFLSQNSTSLRAAFETIINSNTGRDEGVIAAQKVILFSFSLSLFC